MSGPSSNPSNRAPHPLKGKSPWEGLTKAERARRIAKMVASARARRMRPAAAMEVATGPTGRRMFTPEQRAEYVTQIQALVAQGMMVKDACAQVRIGKSQYQTWVNALGVRGNRALAIRRPPAEEVEVTEVPAPRVNGHHSAELSRLDRLAALIVAVEKLL